MQCFLMRQAAIAQLVEQLTCNEKVQGSTPCGGTTLLGKAHGWVLEGLKKGRNWFRCMARIERIQS